ERAVAEVQSRLNTFHSRSTDQRDRWNNFDGRESRGVLLERFHRDPETGQDDSAQILATGPYNVDRRGHPEIDDEQIPIRVEIGGCDRVRDPIGSDFGRIAIADLQSGLSSRLQNERFDAEVFPAATPERVDVVWNHRAESDLLDARGVAAIFADDAAQKQAQFV